MTDDVRDPRMVHEPKVRLKMHASARAEKRLQSSLEHQQRAGESGEAWRPRKPLTYLLPKVVDDCPVDIFGQYPVGFLEKVIVPTLETPRAEILHICGGGLRENKTVDIRVETKPWVVADARELPFADNTFNGIALDPPYVPAWARNYGTTYPATYPLLREAARVLKPGHLLGILHFLVPFTPRGCVFQRDRSRAVQVAMGYQMRAWTVFRKEVPNG